MPPEKSRTNPFKVVVGSLLGCGVTHYYGEWLDAKQCYEDVIVDMLEKRDDNKYSSVRLYEFKTQTQPLEWVLLMSYGI